MELTGQESPYFPLSTKKSEIEDEVSVGANGGTEMMYRQLKSRLPENLLDNFQIIRSRVRHIDKNRIPVLWLHDTWDDPESQHLKDQEKWNRFAQFVFVSFYQFTTYNLAFGIPYSKSTIMKNAIEPIEDHSKSDDIRLIYHTTPHRGLQILVPVYEKLYEEFNGNLHLDVFSNFSLYGNRHMARNAPYEELFQKCRDHPGITYHGAVENEKVREALKEAHIFAFPSIWPETSCIAAMEAMSAKCSIVCPNYAALPETTAGFSIMYPFHEDEKIHTKLFESVLRKTIEHYQKKKEYEKIIEFNRFAKTYADTFYSWDSRADTWKGYLEGLLQHYKS